MMSDDPLVVRIAGRKHVVTETALIGRDPASDIVLADLRVSRHHAVVRHEGGFWVYEDLSSRNGSYSEGRRVERVAVRQRAAIRIGDPENGLRLEFVPPPPTIVGSLPTRASASIGQQPQQEDMASQPPTRENQRAPAREATRVPLAPPWHPSRSASISMSLHADLRVGEDFAGYRLERLLAEGGMGRTYLAWQGDLERFVALKVLSPDVADDPAIRARFQNEGKLALSLEHPNLVSAFEVGEAAGLPFIAMRFVEGSDLGSILAREGALPIKRVLDLVGQAAEAIDHVHAAGLVHRDIKPSNILVSGSHLYLADFGVAKQTAPTRREGTRVGVFVGTLDYAAPEQIRGEKVDGAVDIYSLGCVLFQCLTGEVPFDRPSEFAVMEAHLRDRPPAPSALRPTLPKALDRVIATALAKDKAERYRSGHELIEATRAAVAGNASASVGEMANRSGTARPSEGEHASAVPRRVVATLSPRVEVGGPFPEPNSAGAWLREHWDHLVERWPDQWVVVVADGQVQHFPKQEEAYSAVVAGNLGDTAIVAHLRTRPFIGPRS